MNPSRCSGLLAICSLLRLTPALLLAQPALARHANLYVDAAAKENGDGSREHPFWRITDGIVAAGIASAVGFEVFADRVQQDFRPRSSSQYLSQSPPLGANALLEHLALLRHDAQLAFPLVHVHANIGLFVGPFLGYHVRGGQPLHPI